MADFRQQFSSEQWEDMNRTVSSKKRPADSADPDQPPATKVARSEDRELSSYEEMKHILNDTVQVKNLKSFIGRFYSNLNIPGTKSIVAIAAPSGAGKTQLGITLREMETFNVLHISLGNVPPTDQAPREGDLQPVYATSQIMEPSIKITIAIAMERDLMGDSTLERRSATNLFEQNIPLYTAGFLLRHFGLHRPAVTGTRPGSGSQSVADMAATALEGEAEPQGGGTGSCTVRELRDALERAMHDPTFRLPVAVIDEAWSSRNANSRLQADLLRKIARASGLLSIFMGTSINVVDFVRGVARDSRRSTTQSLRKWAHFIALLPRLHLTDDERDCLPMAPASSSAPPGATDPVLSPVIRLLDYVRNSAEKAGDSTHSANPFIFHRMMDMYMESGADEKPSLDALLAATAALLYHAKDKLRCIDGLRAQVQFVIGGDLGAEDTMCVHNHFARFTQNCATFLHNGEVVQNTGSAYVPWKPTPSFPSLHDDPLLPLVLGGCCEGSIHGHPPPFQLTSPCDSSQTTTLTFAAALIVAHDRARQRGKRADISIVNPLAKSRDGDILECIAAMAVICGSRANGLSGIPIRDFLLRVATELQAEVPAHRLHWRAATELSDWFDGADDIMPAMLCMRSDTYPEDAVQGIGRLDRTANAKEVDALGYDSARREVIVLEMKNRKDPVDASTLAPIFEQFGKYDAPLGIAIVSQVAGVRTNLTVEGANMVKLVVNSANGEVRLEPVGREDGTAPPRSRQRRLLVLMECDEEQVRETLKQGVLSRLYGALDQPEPDF